MSVSLDQPLAERHAQRRRVRKAVLVVLAGALTFWLIGAAQSPASGPVERILLYAIAALVPLHVLFWQLDGIRLLDRIRNGPKPVKLALVFLALGTSPMVLYPLGLIALLASVAAGGGAATPALAVSGLLLLSPIILLLAVALMFILSGYKGG